MSVPVAGGLKVQRVSKKVCILKGEWKTVPSEERGRKGPLGLEGKFQMKRGPQRHLGERVGNWEKSR